MGALLTRNNIHVGEIQDSETLSAFICLEFGKVGLLYYDLKIPVKINHCDYNGKQQI